MDFDTLKNKFPESEIYQNHPLAPYTTVRIGGPADIFINTKTSDEFIKVLSEVSNVTILGNGSNVLISDSGIRGIVIKNSSNNVEFLPDNQVKVDSGVQLPQLLLTTAKKGLSGLEEFAYIPSSVGGAIFGNIHGVNKNNFDKFLLSLEVFDQTDNKVKLLHHSDLQWDYDFSSLQQQRHLIILTATLQLTPGDPEVSLKTINDIITKKVASQSMNSLGCVFKNPPGDSAGRIIDQELGLKGLEIGNVKISLKHANFVLSLGNAKASDYLAVIQKVQSEANTKGFTLEPEIKFLGEF
jgi:UDP-N-acetylmuramate dehydrogenase